MFKKNAIYILTLIIMFIVSCTSVQRQSVGVSNNNNPNNNNPTFEYARIHGKIKKSGTSSSFFSSYVILKDTKGFLYRQFSHDGTFSFENIKSGNFEITILSENCKPHIQTVIANGDSDLGTITLDTGYNKVLFSTKVKDFEYENINISDAIFKVGSFEFTSDNYGDVIVHDINEGTYEVEIKKAGYESYVDKVFISNNFNSPTSFYLLKDNINFILNPVLNVSQTSVELSFTKHTFSDFKYYNLYLSTNLENLFSNDNLKTTLNEYKDKIEPSMLIPNTIYYAGLLVKLGNNEKRFYKTNVVSFKTLSTPMQKPIVSITSKPETITYLNSGYFTWNASDDGSIVKYIINFNGVTFETIKNDYLFSDLDYGIHEFSVVAIDNENLHSDKATYSFKYRKIVDGNILPYLVINDSPKENEILSTNTITITFDGYDDDGSVNGFYYSLNNGDMSNFTKNKSITFTNLSSSNYVFLIKVEDNNGGVSNTKVINFSINQRPTISFLENLPKTINQNSLLFKYIGEDFEGEIKEYVYKYDGIAVTTLDKQFLWTNLLFGFHTFEVYSVDMNDLTSEAVVHSFLYSDSTNSNITPEISFKDETLNGSILNGIFNLTVEFTASDFDGTISGYYYSHNDSEFQFSTKNYVELKNLEVATHKFSIYAKDDKGLKSETKTVNFEINSVPTVIFNSIIPDYINENKITIEISCSDLNDTINNRYLALDGNTFEVFTDRYIFSNLSESAHTISAYCVDSKGVKSKVISKNFTYEDVSNQAPVLQFVSEFPDNKVFTETNEIELRFNATDVDGTVEKIVFINNGVETVMDYTNIIKVNLDYGTYNSSCYVLDNKGKKSNSLTKSFKVNVKPKIELYSPINNSVTISLDFVMLFKIFNDNSQNFFLYIGNDESNLESNYILKKSFSGSETQYTIEDSEKILFAKGNYYWCITVEEEGQKYKSEVWNFYYDKNENQTGSIYFKTIPSSASIYINDSFKGLTPYRYESNSEENLNVRVVFKEYTLSGVEEVYEAITTTEVLKLDVNKTKEIRFFEFEKFSIFYSGLSENKCDILVLGDGYTKDEKSKYFSDVEAFKNYLFNVKPFGDMKDDINIQSLFIPSKQSGSDPGENSDSVDTFYNTTYGLDGVQRALGVRYEDKISELRIGHSKDLFESVDYVIIVVNAQEHGGTGGEYAVYSAGTDVDTAVHELGHIMGNLADEYADEAAANIHLYSYISDYENVDKTNDLSIVKWKEVLALDGASSIIGAYAGGYYRDETMAVWTQLNETVFRPQYTCKMRYLGEEFCYVCMREMAKSIKSKANQSYTNQNFYTNFPFKNLNFRFSRFKIKGISYRGRDFIRRNRFNK